MSLTFADALGNRLLKLVFMFRLKGAAGPHLGSVTSAQVLQAHFVPPPVSSEMRQGSWPRTRVWDGGWERFPTGAFPSTFFVWR